MVQILDKAYNAFKWIINLNVNLEINFDSNLQLLKRMNFFATKNIAQNINRD